MQVGFDSTYVRFEEELEAERRARDAKRKELQRIIIGVKPRGSSDFETLTALYLNHNNIGDLGLHHLLEALKNNTCAALVHG